MHRRNFVQGLLALCGLGSTVVAAPTLAAETLPPPASVGPAPTPRVRFELFYDRTYHDRLGFVQAELAAVLLVFAGVGYEGLPRDRAWTWTIYNWGNTGEVLHALEALLHDDKWELDAVDREVLVQACAAMRFETTAWVRA